MTNKFYEDWAAWWPLISPVEDYAEEATFFLNLLADVTARPPVTLLELGSGGGSNAYYMKRAFASVTLSDLSPRMLAISEVLNPDCEHLAGDIRTVRLDRQFDAVFLHDVLDYMTTLDDLRAAMQTAFVHTRPGGVALFVPDHVRETFEDDTDSGGNDDGLRGVRFLEWSYDRDPNDNTYVTQYVFVFREAEGAVSVQHEEHTLGLFPRDEWLRLLAEVGFEASFVIDDYNRHVFIGRSAAG